MCEELISKKDLLREKEISYGQLYRWKRKNLIPEEWFIKKSVSTGQETFFPKSKIIERIDKILELKDEISLDELADKLLSKNENIKIKRQYIIEHNIVSQPILEKFEEGYGREEYYYSDKLFALRIYNDLITSGVVSIDEANNITKSVKEGFLKIEENSVLLIKRKLGVCFFYVAQGEEIICDNEAKTIYNINLYKVLEEVNLYGRI